MYPRGSQLATFAGKKPCEAIAGALISKGYIKPDADRLAALGLGFPLGCQFSLTVSGSIVSVSLSEDSPDHWRMVIRRDVPVRPIVVSRRKPSADEERVATERVYQLAQELHPVLRSVGDDLTWARVGDAEQAVAHLEPIPPDT